MRHLKVLIIIILTTSFFCVRQLFGQVLTIERCREMSIEHNKSADIAKKTLEKTEYDSKSYFANFFPKFSVSGVYMFSNTGLKKTVAGNYLPTFVPDLSTGELKPNFVTMPDGSPVIGIDGNPVFREYAYFPDMSLDLQFNGMYFVGLRAEQPIYMGGKILSAYHMSLIGKDIASLNKQLTRVEIIVKTDEAYWMHVSAVESLKVAQAFHKVISELLNNVENAHHAGMKSRNDVLKVKVQFNKAELQVLQAKNSIILSRMNLCQIIGIPLNSEFEVLGADEIASSQTISESAVLHYNNQFVIARPEYNILEKQVKLKSEQIKLVRSEFLPNVGIGANYGYMRGLELNGSPLINHASFSGLLTVSIPVFHWGEGMNKIRAARIEKQILELQRDDLNAKMELEAQQSYQKMSEAEMEVTMTAHALEQSAENMRESRDRYDAGMETLADYLEAQTIYQQSGLEYIEALIKKQLSITYFLKNTGRL